MGRDGRTSYVLQSFSPNEPLGTFTSLTGTALPAIQILQNTRALLQENYSQIPQLSCGYQFDLNNSFRI